ncbi:hypothetical protein ACFE04_009805 [Oxalis oulophora]
MSSFSGGPSNEMDGNSRSGNTTSGFRLHIGGRLSFENPWSYIGGSMIADWDLVPGELTMTTLHHTIEIMGYDGSVLSVHYKRPGKGLTVEDHVSHWFKKDLYHDLYTTYIPNPMRIGRDLWPQSDLSPLAAPPPRILKGRPWHKRKPEAGEGFTTVAAGSPTVRRKKVGKGPNASKKGKNARKGPIQTTKGTSSESTHPSSAAVHSQSTFTETSGGSPLLGARMLKSLQVEMTLDEYVQQSPSKRRMVKGLSITQ